MYFIGKCLRATFRMALKRSCNSVDILEQIIWSCADVVFVEAENHICPELKLNLISQSQNLSILKKKNANKILESVCVEHS